MQNLAHSASLHSGDNMHHQTLGSNKTDIDFPAVSAAELDKVA